MTKTNSVLLALALALDLHFLGALTNVLVIMWLAGSVALGLVVGGAAALGGDDDAMTDDLPTVAYARA